MIPRDHIPFRLIIAAQLMAMAWVRTYFGAPRTEASGEVSAAHRAESAWLTATLGVLALLHFGAIIAYLVNPPLLQWTAFEVAAPIRWIAILTSCIGAVGEIWAAVSLGASYSPLLRLAEERVVVTAGPYRWIRHPLYAFGLPLMAGWGVAAGSWFILATAMILIMVLMIIRVPREEAMMLEGFGESYRHYMTRTGRFLPRLRPALPT
jgi:protein-S-isoprenylcysteine O-methyltransferase Ste14